MCGGRNEIKRLRSSSALSGRLTRQREESRAAQAVRCTDPDLWVEGRDQIELNGFLAQRSHVQSLRREASRLSPVAQSIPPSMCQQLVSGTAITHREREDAYQVERTEDCSHHQTDHDEPELRPARCSLRQCGAVHVTWIGGLIRHGLCDGIISGGSPSFRKGGWSWRGGGHYGKELLEEGEEV